MIERTRQLAGLALLLLSGCANSLPFTPVPVPVNKTPARAVTPPPASIITDQPPAPAREFRGLWISSVGNLDWPSKPGLPTAQQQAEFRAILDRAVQLHLNAVLLQVRPDCDALYDSKLEPWSPYLTGKMGRAPAPYYDPLAFAVTEAHQRGLELHAWINPFRAGVRDEKMEPSSDHVTRARPELVRRAGNLLVLDPSDPRARGYTLAVIEDIVRRYDIDGLHMDDYFYPYPDAGRGYNSTNFPDDTAWRSYLRGGGRLSRADWRRDNVNVFVREVYLSIKKIKPWVKFGISPFGVWRPGHPADVTAKLDAYESIYADSQKWLASGWVDYFSPQLYWPAPFKDQNFASLLGWWSEQNHSGRHLWPGIMAGYWPNWNGKLPGETTREINLTRDRPGATGNLLFRASFLMSNTNGVDAELAKIYDSATLVPASPWLGTNAPGKPAVAVNKKNGAITVSWRMAAGEPAWLWVVQKEIGDAWSTEILAAPQLNQWLKAAPGTIAPRVMSVTGVSRLGILGAPTVFSLETP